jgi:hypothetical protein
MAAPTQKHVTDLPFIFSANHKITSMFCANAKTYIQLSGAALVLTLTFAREIFHIQRNLVDVWLILMWSCFLLAVVAGAFYQYLAAQSLERYFLWYTAHFWDWLPPQLVYGIMLIAFYGGTVIFTIYAIRGLTHLPQPS